MQPTTTTTKVVTLLFALKDAALLVPLFDSKVLLSHSAIEPINYCTHKHKKNEHVRSSCAYAYAAGVLTCLHMWLVLLLMLTFMRPVYALVKTRLKIYM